MGFQDWKTPPEFFDACCRLGFGTPTIDVAASMENKMCMKWIGKNYLTIQDDALADDTYWFWAEHTVAWCNPPFKNMRAWVEKAISELIRASETSNQPRAIIMLAPLSRAKWVDHALKHSAFAAVCAGDRIQFTAPEGINETGNRSDNSVIVFTTHSVKHPSVKTSIGWWNWRDQS
jgi:phage N-6-adenine-methyltransferase